MDDLGRRLEELRIKLASLEREINRVYRELNSSRTDPVRRDAVLDCYNKLLAERENTRAELEAIEKQLAATNAPTRRARKRDGEQTKAR